MVRLQRHGATLGGDSLLDLQPVGMHETEIVVCPGVVRRQRYRTQAMVQGLVQARLATQDFARVAVVNRAVVGTNGVHRSIV